MIIQKAEVKYYAHLNTDTTVIFTVDQIDNIIQFTEDIPEKWRSIEELKTAL